MSKHAKTSTLRANYRLLFVAVLALAFIASIIGAFGAKANDNAVVPTQQVFGTTGECKVNAQSSCIIAHGLGVKPTAVDVTPGGPGQLESVNPALTNDKTFTVKFNWHTGATFILGTTIKYNVVYTYVGAPITTEPTPTASPTTVSPTASPTVTTPPVSTPTTPTSSPTTPTTSPTATTTIPADKSCSPTNTIAHFTGEGSDAIGDAPSTETWGQYNVSAEQWAVEAGYSSNLCAYSKDNWYVEIKAIDHGQHSVQSYPSMRKIYHDWGNGGDFSKDPKVSSMPQLKAEVAHQSPDSCEGCIYEEAFDIWLNGIGGNKPELMIWTHNVDQTPYGNLKATNITVDGRQWDYYNSGNYMAFVPHDKNAQINDATFDLKPFIKYVEPVVGTDPTLGQISYGVEPVDTNGEFKRWDFTKFKITDK